jgi:hypothetical protein
MIQQPKNNTRNGDPVTPPHPKKLKTKMSSSKVLASIFWYKDGILIVDYLEKDAAIMAMYYIAFFKNTGLQTSRQASERNCVSSRLCCSSQSSHHA